MRERREAAPVHLTRQPLGFAEDVRPRREHRGDGRVDLRTYRRVVFRSAKRQREVAERLRPVALDAAEIDDVRGVAARREIPEDDRRLEDGHERDDDHRRYRRPTPSPRRLIHRAHSTYRIGYAMIPVVLLTSHFCDNRVYGQGCQLLTSTPSCDQRVWNDPSPSVRRYVCAPK